MTAAQPDTVTRQYEVSFEGQDAPVHVDLEAPARRLMIDNFLFAVARAQEILSASEPDAETRRITGFRKAGETIRFAVEGEYTNGGTPPTWIDSVFAVDEEDAEFATKLAVALNEGWDFSNLVSLRKHMKIIPVLECRPEPYSKDDITASLADFLSAYNAGENVTRHISHLTKMVETCGHNIREGGPIVPIGDLTPKFGEDAFNRITQNRLRAIEFRLIVEPQSGLETVTNQIGDGQTPTDDSQAYALVLCAAPKMALAIRRALPWLEGTGIADSDPPEYLALKSALEQAIC
ncbi:hypothetical protein IC232_04840 [Microvirga sp. BT688]|uniref:hypothetical protein n=1 Tax=Microvirga sp. TaxID=1873136 RepID=UPI001685D07C|nr:hypothetical protein [Microvirga sp.]MBD2746023.1 hypothetical protein [Microvirga sp.]